MIQKDKISVFLLPAGREHYFEWCRGSERARNNMAPEYPNLTSSFDFTQMYPLEG